MARQIFRYCAVTVAIAALAFCVVLAAPAVPSSALWSDALARRAQLTSTKAARNAAPSASAGGKPTIEVLAEYPHDSKAFTQGFVVAQQGTEKFFIESTGLYGESTLRKVDIPTGRVLSKHDFDRSVFGEGVTLGKNGELVMLTWKEKQGYVFELDASSNDDALFKVTSTFTFETTTGEGWGIDYDGTHLVVSDGSSTIMFWDAHTKTVVRTITVTFNGQAIPQLNELEVANGFIYANIWYHTAIVKIDPASGDVVAVFDCSALMKQSGAAPDNSGAVLNGIAYDGDEDVFYLTGKQWARVFKVRLLE